MLTFLRSKIRFTFSLFHSSFEELEKIIDNYHQKLKSKPKRKSLTNFDELTEACCDLDLENSLELVYSKLLAAKTLEEAQAAFIDVVRQRMLQLDGTLLSPEINPNTSANQFCWEIHKTLFPNDSDFLYLRQFNPKAKLLVVEEKIVAPKTICAFLQELELTHENIAKLGIKISECVFVDNFVLPLHFITRHTDVITSKLNDIKQRNYIFADILKALQNPRYMKVRECLFQHPAITELYNKVRILSEKGEQTLGEAIEEFKQALLMSSTVNTGKAEALPEAEAKFRAYIKRLPDCQQLLQTVASLDRTLGEIISRLVRQDHLCVHFASMRLDEILRNRKNEIWLQRLPPLTQDARQAQLTQIHQFWQHREFRWQPAKGNLPADYLKEVCPRVQYSYSGDIGAVEILKSVRSLQNYEILVSNKSLVQQIENNFTSICEQLSDGQFRALLTALKPKLQSFNINSVDFNFWILLSTQEKRTMMCEAFVDSFPVLANRPQELCILLSSPMSEAQCRIVCQALKSKLPDMVKSVSDFYVAFSYLYNGDGSKSSVLTNVFPTFIKTAKEFRELYRLFTNHKTQGFDWVVSPEQMRRNFYTSYKAYLPKIIHTLKDLGDVLYYLDDEQAKEIFQQQDVNAQLVRQKISSSKDLEYLFKNINSEKRTNFYNVFKSHIVELIETEDDISVLYYLKEDERQAIFQSVILKQGQQQHDEASAEDYVERFSEQYKSRVDGSAAPRFFRSDVLSELGGKESVLERLAFLILYSKSHPSSLAAEVETEATSLQPLLNVAHTEY